MSHSSTTTTGKVLGHAAGRASRRERSRASRNPGSRRHLVALALAIGITGAIAGLAGLASLSISNRGAEATGAPTPLGLRTGSNADLGALDQLWATSRGSQASDSTMSTPGTRTGADADVGAMDLLRAR